MRLIILHNWVTTGSHGKFIWSNERISCEAWETWICHKSEMFHTD
jgi:Fe-S cluster biosynthesis and repair protein YggX